VVIRWPCRGASTTTAVAGVTTIFTFAVALVVATFVGVGVGAGGRRMRSCQRAW
jgi:hypothetical protein